MELQPLHKRNCLASTRSSAVAFIAKHRRRVHTFNISHTLNLMDSTGRGWFESRVKETDDGGNRFLLCGSGEVKTMVISVIGEVNFLSLMEESQRRYLMVHFTNYFVEGCS